MALTSTEASAMDDSVHSPNLFPDKRLLDRLRSGEQTTEVLQEIADAFSKVMRSLSRFLLSLVFVRRFRVPSNNF
jgi:hypothetical protein